MSLTPSQTWSSCKIEWTTSKEQPAQMVAPASKYMVAPQSTRKPSRLSSVRNPSQAVKRKKKTSWTWWRSVPRCTSKTTSRRKSSCWYGNSFWPWCWLECLSLFCCSYLQRKRTLWSWFYLRWALSFNYWLVAFSNIRTNYNTSATSLWCPLSSQSWVFSSSKTSSETPSSKIECSSWVAVWQRYLPLTWTSLPLLWFIQTKRGRLSILLLRSCS